MIAAAETFDATLAHRLTALNQAYIILGMEGIFTLMLLLSKVSSGGGDYGRLLVTVFLFGGSGYMWRLCMAVLVELGDEIERGSMGALEWVYWMWVLLNAGIWLAGKDFTGPANRFFGKLRQESFYQEMRPLAPGSTCTFNTSTTMNKMDTDFCTFELPQLPEYSV